MFEDPLILLLWFAATYAVANIVIGMIQGTREILGIEKIKLLNHINKIVHRVTVEKHNDIYFWYDYDDNEFLAQGVSDDEIINKLKERFPTHIFFLPSNHLVCSKTDWKLKEVQNYANLVDQ
jgi:hypothetical protein